MSDNKDLLSIEEYSPDEFEQLTWKRYGEILDNLHDQISKYAKNNQITFDAVVPVLRGGMVVATYLTGKLKILRVLPVQYKYFIQDNQVYLKKLLPLPEKIELKENPNILVAENCYCFGTTTKAAIKDVRNKYLSANIYVAADRIDYTYKDIEEAKKVFYGELTNDTKKLSDEKCKKLGINPTQYYYPWETLDEEIAASQLKQYDYVDLEDTEKGSEIIEHFDFS